jgi:hypothetical protein
VKRILKFNAEITVPLEGPPASVFGVDVATGELCDGPAPGTVWVDLRAQVNLDTSKSAAGGPERRAFLYAPMWIFDENPTGDGPLLATSRRAVGGESNTNGTGNGSSHGTGPADVNAHVELGNCVIGDSERVIMTYDPGSPWQIGDHPSGALIVEELPAP